MSGPLVDIIMVASCQRAQPMMAVEASEAFCSGTRRPSGLHKHHRQRAGTDSAITDRSIAANRGFDVFVSLVGCKNTECFPVFEADLMIREDQQGKSIIRRELGIRRDPKPKIVTIISHCVIAMRSMSTVPDHAIADVCA